MKRLLIAIIKVIWNVSAIRSIWVMVHEVQNSTNSISDAGWNLLDEIEAHVNSNTMK